MSWMSGKCLPVPYPAMQMKPMAASPAGSRSCSEQLAGSPTILSRGNPTCAASFRVTGVMAPTADGKQGYRAVRGPDNQGVDERGIDHRNHRRPRRPLAFQALVALDTAVDVVDGFALFPDQFHAVDATIALVQEGQIVDEAI